MKVFTYSVLNKKIVGLQVNEGIINFSHAWEVYCAIENRKDSCISESILDMIKNGIFSGYLFEDLYGFLCKHKILEKFIEKRDIKFEVPVINPTKILAVARNYHAHAKELGNQPVEEPIIFSKTINTMLPHQEDIIYPKQLTRVDHEIELGVFIGKKIKYVNLEEAIDSVAGYTIVNDITARDLQKVDLSNEWPWLRSKNFDTFLPVGPYIVPKEFVKEPEKLELILSINGEEKQRGNTSCMINSVPKLISYISKYMTLFPGDIICTGTPEGVSPLKDGDIIEATIEGIGTLVNSVKIEE